MEERDYLLGRRLFRCERSVQRRGDTVEVHDVAADINEVVPCAPAPAICDNGATCLQHRDQSPADRVDPGGLPLQGGYGLPDSLASAMFEPKRNLLSDANCIRGSLYLIQQLTLRGRQH